jgi:hypothetical protein
LGNLRQSIASPPRPALPGKRDLPVHPDLFAARNKGAYQRIRHLSQQGVVEPDLLGERFEVDHVCTRHCGVVATEEGGMASLNF